MLTLLLNQPAPVDFPLVPGKAGISFTGYAPSVNQSAATNYGPGAALITFTGYAPSVSRAANVALVPGSASIVFTGLAPSVAQVAAASINPGVAALVLTGFAPTVQRGTSVALVPGVGTITFTGYAPAVTQSGVTPPTTGNGFGFEIGGVRSTYHKPLLQRIMEARAQRVRPAKTNARKRARTIEVEAAQVALADGGEAQFRELMAKWLAQRPVIPESTGIDPYQLFMAQVAMQIQRMQEEQAAHAAYLAFEQDEEEALIALLMA